MRGIPLLVPRRFKNEEGRGTKSGNTTEESDFPPILPSVGENIASIENCFLVLQFYARSGAEKETFQTKASHYRLNLTICSYFLQLAARGDRNPNWVDEFCTDPIRHSEILPGGLDPIERLDISLYDQRTISQGTLLYSAITESFLIGKVTIPLQLLRLHTINQWFTLEPATSSKLENWHVALHITLNMTKKKRMST